MGEIRVGAVIGQEHGDITGGGAHFRHLKFHFVRDGIQVTRLERYAAHVHFLLLVAGNVGTESSVHGGTELLHSIMGTDASPIGICAGAQMISGAS